MSRCTKERIALFRSEILRRQIDALNKSLKAASKARRTDQARSVEEQIKDLRSTIVVPMEGARDATAGLGSQL